MTNRDMLEMWRKDWMQKTRTQATKTANAYSADGKLGRMCRAHAHALRVAVEAFDQAWHEGMRRIEDEERDAIALVRALGGGRD